ncbi:MAG: hypothetical protein AAF745_04510 [Planctomycetota bacterium]
MSRAADDTWHDDDDSDAAIDEWDDDDYDDFVKREFGDSSGHIASNIDRKWAIAAVIALIAMSFPLIVGLISLMTG